MHICLSNMPKTAGRPVLSNHLTLLLLFCLATTSTALGQAAAGGSPPSVVDRAEGSVGFNFIRANAPPGNCDCFNALGGYGSVGFHITNWLTLEGEVTGQHKDKIGTLGQNLTLLTYTAGPKLSVPGRRFVPFVQALFGEAEASDSYFPDGKGGSTSTASSFAFQLGGGLDYNITRHFGVRVVNAEFLRTSFPNGADNSQNHLSLGAGLIVRFGNKNTGPNYKPMPAPPEEPVAPPPPVPATVAAPPPPPPPPPPPAPVVNIQMICSTDVKPVDQGAAFEISAKTITLPEGLTVTFTWTPEQGPNSIKIVGSGSRVLVDTVGLPAGRYSIHGQATVAASTSRADCDVPFRVKTKEETRLAPSNLPTGPVADLDQDREFHENVPDALFDTNSAVIRPDTQAAINRAKVYLDQHPNIRVLVGGFADIRGTSEYNLDLGMKRATATRNAMIAAGIAPERLEIVTYGKGVQVCTEQTEACRRQNRRVAFSMHP